MLSARFVAPLQPCKVDCVKGKRCRGSTNWTDLINFGGFVANGACIILTEGVGALLCTGVTAVVQTVLDQVVDRANHKDRASAAFRNGFVAAAPFLLTFVKEVLKKWATSGDGAP